MTSLYSSPAPLTAPIVTSNHVVLKWSPSTPLDTAPVLTGELVTFELVSLSWAEGVIGGVLATEYDIYRSVDGGSFALLDTVTGLEFDDATVDLEAESYAYYVVARVDYAESDASNEVSFGGETGGIVELFDVNDISSWPSVGQCTCIDVDPVNNRLFFSASDRTQSVYLSFIKVFDIDEAGDITEVFSETIELLPDEDAFTTFRDYFSIIYGGDGKVYVPRHSGMTTYDYDEETGALTLSKHTYEFDSFPSGRVGKLSPIVMSPGGVRYLVCSAGRNDTLQSCPLPAGEDHGDCIRTPRETYYNYCAKLTEEIFYVADSSGNNLTRNSIDSDGVITLLDSVVTGMATSGLDNGDHVHCNVYNGYVYAQETSAAQIPPLEPTRRWPITNLSTGTLGAAEDGYWDFRGDYQYMMAMCSPGLRQALEHNGHTYFIRRADGNLDLLSRT